MVLAKNYYNQQQTRIADRYVYYRIYSADGGIVSKHAVDAEESFLARVMSNLVPPPHTVASLKNCICRTEDIRDSASTSLFVSRLSQSALGDDLPIAITTSPGPGYKAEDPIALVIDLNSLNASDIFGDTVESVSDTKTAVIAWVKNRRMGLSRSTPKPKYIYYRVYRDSALPATEPFKRSDPTLARININRIPPPHTAASLKRCICKIERIEDYELTKLYEPTNITSPLNDEVQVPILSGGFAGTAKTHMSLVLPTV